MEAYRAFILFSLLSLLFSFASISIPISFNATSGFVFASLIYLTVFAANFLIASSVRFSLGIV